VIPAGSTLVAISATATFANADSSCKAVDLLFDTDPFFLHYLAGWFHVDPAGTNVAANSYLGQTVTPTSDAHLKLRIGSCYDSTDPLTANPVPPSPYMTATATVKLTWTHPARPIS
jgi:hypothetical protein